MELFNTLTGRVEPFFPATALTSACTPADPPSTDYGHIGNFRTFIHVDVLRRYLKQIGMDVRHVMNVTDVDDKIIRNAAAANLDIGEYSAKYESAFFEDMASLNLELPEVVPHATDNIPEMVALIENLRAQDIAYQAEDGSWYFRIARFPEYASYRKKISKESKTEHASTSTNTRRTPPAISPFGRGRQNQRERRPRTCLGDLARRGPARLAYRVLRHGHQVPRRDFDLHAAAKTSCFRTTRTRSRSPNPPATRSSHATGCTSASCS